MSTPVFDAAGPANQFTNATSLTFSHTCSGSDRILFVGAMLDGSSPPTGVTYNGVAMTLVDSVSFSWGAKNQSLWRLIAPATGANNVVISRASASNIFGTSLSLTNVDSTTPLGTSVTGAENDGSTPATVNVSSATGELVIDTVGWANGSGAALTAGAGQTKRVEALDAGGSGSSSAMSEEAGASTVTMSWTRSAEARPWGLVGVSVKGVASSGGMKKWTAQMQGGMCNLTGGMQ